METTARSLCFIYFLLREEVSHIEQTLDELVAAYRKFEADAKQAEAKKAEVKAQLQPLIEAQGGKWSDAVGYARMIEASTTVSYDRKALDVLCESDPDLKDRIGIYRKETPKAAYLQVK